MLTTLTYPHTRIDAPTPTYSVSLTDGSKHCECTECTFRIGAVVSRSKWTQFPCVFHVVFLLPGTTFQRIITIIKLLLFCSCEGGGWPEKLNDVSVNFAGKSFISFFPYLSHDECVFTTHSLYHFTWQPYFIRPKFIYTMSKGYLLKIAVWIVLCVFVSNSISHSFVYLQISHCTKRSVTIHKKNACNRELFCTIR